MCPRSDKYLKGPSHFDIYRIKKDRKYFAFPSEAIGSDVAHRIQVIITMYVNFFGVNTTIVADTFTVTFTVTVTEPYLAGGKGGSCPPGPVERDTSSPWMELLSLDLDILIIVTCNCLPFSGSRSIFRETYLMTSAVNSVSEPLNLKIFWGRIPVDPP